MKTEWIQIKIDPEMKERFKIAAESMGLNMSALVRLAVTRYIDRSDQAIKESEETNNG